MVTVHINQIDYCQWLANNIRVMNMQLFHSNDARIDQIEFKNRAVLRETYSAFGRLKMLALDPGSLCEWSGSD